MTMRAIVTGAGSGIGEATAAYFEAHGGIVARLGRNRIDQPLSFQCDVTGEASVCAAIDAAAKALGGVDAVVANAGVTFHGTLEETTLDDWEELFAVNARGVFLTARAAIPHLRATRGALVTVASQAAVLPQAGLAAYSASKAAVLAMSQSIALDYAADGIRVNSILPGPTLTPMKDRAWARSEDPAAARAASFANVAHGRMIESKEIAAAIYFLCSPECSSMIGSALLVDGGYRRP